MSQGNREYLQRTTNGVRSETRVGSQFQASIPTPVPYRPGDVSSTASDKLLWNPGKLPENEVKAYLTAVKSRGCQGQGEEQVLFLLHQCNYNIEEAIRRSKLRPRASSFGATWSEDECQRFETGLERHGKEFNLVQKLVRTRSVGDIVEFYYFWKKTERYDVFINEKSCFGRSKFKRKSKRKNYRSVEHADAILDEEQLSYDRNYSPDSPGQHVT